MNSVFVNPGIYSCAVDAFLEVSTHLFFPYLSHLPARNEFTDVLLIVISGAQYKLRGVVRCNNNHFTC